MMSPLPALQGVFVGIWLACVLTEGLFERAVAGALGESGYLGGRGLNTPSRIWPDLLY